MSGKATFLNNPKYLFTILAALVKKNGGKLIITKEDLEAVIKSDLITMSVDPETSSIIFKSTTQFELPNSDEYEN